MGEKPRERGSVGVTPLTRREWLFYCLSAAITTGIGVFLWAVVFSLLSPHFIYPVLIGSIVTFSAILLCILMWLRYIFSHLFWLKLWTIATPLLLSSINIF